MNSNGTTSDFGSAFSNGFNNGKQRYGNTMTHFSDDGRLITNADDVSYPHQRPSPRNPHQNRGLPDIPDYRSYDPGRDRTRRNNERNRTDNWRERENRREAEREREYKSRDFYNPPGNHGAGYPRREYGGGRGATPGMDQTPVYGRTLPLPLLRNQGDGPPTRRFDDYRTHDMRPNYEKSHNRFNDRFQQGHHEQKSYDWRMPFAANRYDNTGLVASRNHGGRYGVLATKKDAVYRERPIGWYFLLAGLILFAAGLNNLLNCKPNYSYCFIWLGPLTLVLGIVGIGHRDYKSQCWNVCYIANGSLLAIAAMVASGLVLLDYVPLVKELANVTNITEYSILVSARPDKPLLTKLAPDTRTWLCLSFDSAGLIFVIGDYMALYAVILVAHKYWNQKKRISKSVKPYCSPALFNPFMQMLWGELLVLIGLVAVFGSYGTEWSKYWSGVGAGIFIIITGAVSSWAAKMTNKTSVSALAIFMNFCGIIASATTIVLHILGVKDNIEGIQKDSDTYAGWLYASAIIFSILLAVALICFFYCIGLLVRFSYYLTRSGYDRDAFTTSSRSDQTVSTVRRYGYEKDPGFDAGSDPPLPYRTPQRAGLFGRWR